MVIIAIYSELNKYLKTGTAYHNIVSISIIYT